MINGRTRADDGRPMDEQLDEGRPMDDRWTADSWTSDDRWTTDGRPIDDRWATDGRLLDVRLMDGRGITDGQPTER
ncbi:hypothetical protein DPMN_126816 [Dreissena polymorpha]|uniref:Uncharacterized protein n=1 Tax=Dreissena polymorpha TaxID=45954 RepID=A0A9D4GWH5_DREPO|nr:hypothetical protein DPMN_126816 [Dreissena polymorpha]